MEFPKLSPFLGLIFRTLPGLPGRGTGCRHHLLPTTLNRTAPRSAAAPLPATAAAPRWGAERSGAVPVPARARPAPLRAPAVLRPRCLRSCISRIFSSTYSPRVSIAAARVSPFPPQPGGSGGGGGSAGDGLPAGLGASLPARLRRCVCAAERRGEERSGAGRRARGEQEHDRERWAAGRGRAAL